ncbi:methyl-accepting chemotaxis protein [Comamonas aquatica]|uniref:methyl-accepting chemotaxis protein n=1 Tax=Comamonas aquatica TaxID=225991 RepID=UPI00244A80E8|nr:methyl-accepting chemotaxis protein [Comamonas aquatica]MDH1672934.1 methyl-accepting chemotaxis protein [Comamonas aquatica]MDH1676498.1 methyl-accepting chemotaxis protein [Comamonas aquatica]
MPSFNSLRLTQRYMLVFFGYFASMAVVIGMSWYGLMSSRDSLRSLHDESLQRILLADSINESVSQMRMQTLLSFQHAPDNPLSALHDHPTSSHLELIRHNLDKGVEWQQQLAKIVTEPMEKEMFAETIRAQNAWNAKLGEIVRGLESGDFSSERMSRFLALGREEGDMLVALVGAFKGLQITQADVAYQAASERYHFSILVFVLCVLLGGLPATLLSVSLLRRMSHGFKSAHHTAQTIAAGDISQRVPVSGKDEITELLVQMEDMRMHLHDIIYKVRSGADAIAGASTQVAAGTGDLSMRTEQQAASLQQTASATEELSSTVQQNADSASRASELASGATEVAQRGGEMVSQVVATMEDINTSAKKIEAIIGVIDSIAFQTNILALNAAVEAARAGEQGRGFAVVASEVRSLAGRSAEAAKEIKVLINDSVNRVRVGSDQVHRTGKTMEDIVQSIARVSSIVHEIADASREQSKGLAQINDAVSNLDDVTQQNAALVEETSAASSALQEQARQMAEMSAQFVLEAGATTGTPYISSYSRPGASTAKAKPAVSQGQHTLASPALAPAESANEAA